MTRLDNDGLPLLRREARPAPAYSGPTAHQITDGLGGDPTGGPVMARSHPLRPG